MSLRQTAKGKTKASTQPASDDDEDKPLPERLPDDPKTVRLRRRAEALLWILFAVGLAHWTGFYDAFMAQTGEWTFFASAGCLVAFFGIFVYVQYVSPLLTGRRIQLTEWEREIPGLIGIATVLGCLGFIFMSAMLWPAYHLGAPVILFFEWAGAVAAMTLW